MMKKSRRRKLLAFLGITFCLAGCNESADIQNWAERAGRFRIEALRQGEILPYRRDQFIALKRYFAEVGRMALNLETDPLLAELLNTLVTTAGLGPTCEKVFLTRIQWQAMVDRCTRNNFFLCAEEVRAYPEMVITIRRKLASEQQRQFDQTPSCRAAL